MKTDKVKEVLEDIIVATANDYGGFEGFDESDKERIDEAAHQLNQMLREEYRRGGYYELAKLKSHKIVSPDGVFNKAEQHKRLSKLAKEAGSTESELNQMLIEARIDTLQKAIEAGRVKIAPLTYDTDNAKIGRYVRKEFLKALKAEKEKT